jgi:hypothetical protein
MKDFLLRSRRVETCQGTAQELGNIAVRCENLLLAGEKAAAPSPVKKWDGYRHEDPDRADREYTRRSNGNSSQHTVAGSDLAAYESGCGNSVAHWKSSRMEMEL